MRVNKLQAIAAADRENRRQARRAAGHNDIISRAEEVGLGVVARDQVEVIRRGKGRNARVTIEDFVGHQGRRLYAAMNAAAQGETISDGEANRITQHDLRFMARRAIGDAYSSSTRKLTRETRAALMNAYRDARGAFGDPIAGFEPPKGFKRFGFFGEGPVDAPTSIYSIAEVDGRGRFKSPGTRAQPITMYFEHAEFGKEPKVWGPFSVLSNGLLLRDDTPPSLVKDGGIDGAALEYVAKRMFSEDSPFFGPVALGRQQSVRAVERSILKELRDELSHKYGRPAVLERVHGRGAIERFIREAFGGGDYEPMMRSVLADLDAGGQIASAHYYRLEATFRSYTGRLSMISSSSDVLVIVDRKGQAFALHTGTLSE